MFRGIGEQGVLQNDVLPEPPLLREVHWHHLRGLHHDTRMPQPAQVCQQGIYYYFALSFELRLSRWYER